MGKSFSILYGYRVVDMQKWARILLSSRRSSCVAPPWDIFPNDIFNHEYLLCSGDNTAFESLVRLLTILVFRVLGPEIVRLVVS